jgi:hypothetical protein
MQHSEPQHLNAQHIPTRGYVRNFTLQRYAIVANFTNVTTLFFLIFFDIRHTALARTNEIITDILYLAKN